MRFILKCNKYTKINNMLKVLEILDVKEKIYFNRMILIFKIVNDLTPVYLKNRIKKYDVNYNLRDTEKLYISKCKSNKRYKTLFYAGLSEYNKLPTEIKKIVNNVNQFKNALKKHIINNRRD